MKVYVTKKFVNFIALLYYLLRRKKETFNFTMKPLQAQRLFACSV
jgi:hypothetical protein